MAADRGRERHDRRAAKPAASPLAGEKLLGPHAVAPRGGQVSLQDAAPH